MKTKDEQNSIPQRRGIVAAEVTDLQTEAREKSVYVADSKRWLVGGIPHPRYFRKRGCKLLKTNDGSVKKRAKRRQLMGEKGVKRDWAARDERRENWSSVLGDAALRHLGE